MQRLLVPLMVLPLAAVGFAASPFPNPVTDPAPSTANHKETAVLAGGCFWGVEAVFESLKGVSDVVSGYAGGAKSTAHYEMVSTGQTGHAESVRITFDPSKISFGQLLKIYFAVAHDPTEMNRQGPDHGTQYRSAIFYTNDDQKRVAETYIHQLTDAKVFPRPIVTQIVPLQAFYRAEDEHQDFIARNPTYPYVVYNDLPKLKRLREQFPELLKKDSWNSLGGSNISN